MFKTNLENEVKTRTYDISIHIKGELRCRCSPFSRLYLVRERAHRSLPPATIVDRARGTRCDRVDLHSLGMYVIDITSPMPNSLQSLVTVLVGI